MKQKITNLLFRVFLKYLPLFSITISTIMIGMTMCTHTHFHKTMTICSRKLTANDCRSVLMFQSPQCLYPVLSTQLSMECNAYIRFLVLNCPWSAMLISGS